MTEALAEVDLLAELARATIALFLIVNPIGNLPLVASVTAGMDRGQRAAIFRTAVNTAAGLLVVFAFAGQQLLQLFGITLQSFQIAGGALLLILSIEILLRGEWLPRNLPVSQAGVVPIGFPLLVGPGALTTTIVTLQRAGLIITVVSVVGVMVLTWLTLRLIDPILRVLGQTGAVVVARVMAVFIAAIAIQFVLEGVRFYFR